MLWREAATPRRDSSSVRSYAVRQARTPAIRASFGGSSGRAAMLNRDVRARRQAPPRAILRHSSLTAPAGGWIRRRRGRETEPRRAGKRRVVLALRENYCFSRSEPHVRGAFCFWEGGEGDRLEGSGNESTCEAAGRLGQADEAAMENGSRAAHGKPRPACTPLREQQKSSFFFPIFLRGSSMYQVSVIYVTGLVVFASCTPFMRNDSRKYQGRSIIVVLHLF